MLNTNMRTSIRNSYPYRVLGLLRGYATWGRRRFAAPSPHFIKQACLIRNGAPNATWVETGTYLGQTTAFLARHGDKVYSIEPEPALFANARRYFRGFANVEVLNGTSEQIFPGLLPRISGNVNFWLDGHYSAGITFKGRQDTPILDELEEISSNLSRFDKVCVLVDDIRCFNPNQAEYSTYPSIDVLVDWARRNHMHWHIEHDIFVARNHPDAGG
jgi:hypothetical protein